MSHAWMPLYVGDYLGKTRRLSALEHGVYMLLIMEYWQSRGLPNDDAQLARIAVLSDKEWTKVRPAMLQFFNEGWQHDRIDEELAKADAKHEKRVQAGSNGGKAKAAKEANAKPPPSNASSNALASSSQSPSPIDATHQLTRDEVDRIEAEVRREAGLENDNSPGLLVIGPILDLLRKDYTLQGHILPAARKLKATGKKLSSWTYLAKMVEGAAAETTAIKPAAPVVDPVVFVQRNDWRWNGCAERYERACGLKAKASESEGGIQGRRFPKRIVDEVEATALEIPASLKRTPEAA